MPAFVPAVSDCAHFVTSPIEYAITAVESSFNPYAIGVVGSRLARQPRNLNEAVATAASLEAQGLNFSVGCRQLNKKNLDRYGLTLRTAFDAKTNSHTGNDLYRDCRQRAITRFGNDDAAERAALSCYYSGNFITGQRKEANQLSYVDKVLRHLKPSAATDVHAIPVIHGTETSARRESPAVASTADPVMKAGARISAGWDVFNDF